ncbi:hypothetical protein F4801DRAFT_533281 [Xylaria longipes]|nr:hypothetical protein F4801DRAFT_533281 [Xylaria longipes]RYC54121.1 hypothetical protein CHU98_g12089 [Xylaria longipes]
MATTTIFDASKSPSSLSPYGNGQQHEGTPTSNPPPQTGSPKPSWPSQERESYRLMTKGEWLQFCRGIGILKDEESEEVIRATSRLWPPSGFRDGLYNDVLYEKTKYTYYYHALCIVAWLLMLLQLALSAILTALGATSSSNGTPITILAAINTSVAGILALLHNSGLPDRYRWDRNEFYKLEEHIKAVVDTGLVPATHGVNDVIAECFGMFATALQTVQNNAPSMYIPAVGPSKPPATALAPVPAKKFDSKK